MTVGRFYGITAKIVSTQLVDIDGIKGAGQVEVAAQEVRDRVNRTLAQLPRTARQPTVEKLDPDSSPIMTLVLSAPRPIRDISESGPASSLVISRARFSPEDSRMAYITLRPFTTS
jgi:hypothetical protein